jgi:hypothetical protein
MNRSRLIAVAMAASMTAALCAPGRGAASSSHASSLQAPVFTEKIPAPADSKFLPPSPDRRGLTRGSMAAAKAEPLLPPTKPPTIPPRTAPDLGVPSASNGPGRLAMAGASVT